MRRSMSIWEISFSPCRKEKSHWNRTDLMEKFKQLVPPEGVGIEVYVYDGNSDE